VTYTPLSNEVRVAAEVIARIKEGLSADDEDFAAIVESETDLPARLIRMLHIARDEEADAKILAQKIDDMRARKVRKENKAERLRHTVKWAMEEAGLTKLPTPEVTASLSMGKPPLVITDESLIPASFCRIKREPDKIKIRELLEAGSFVQGTHLGNPSPTLRVSWK
jgi:hypothetical protein